MGDHRYCITGAKAGDQLIYEAFREHGVEHFYIELVDKCLCHGRGGLRKKEGEYIRDLKPNLNINIAGRTSKEPHQDNRENNLATMRTYYQEDKQHLAQNNGNNITEKKLRQPIKHVEKLTMTV